MNSHTPQLPAASREFLKKYAKSIDQFAEAIPAKVARRKQKKEHLRARKDHNRFIRFLRSGRCSFCKLKLVEFDLNMPCLHWILRPAGVDKKHIKIICEKFGFYRLEAYLRWLANSEIFATKINDLSDEASKDKIFEHTIRYKNFEWAFSCSEGDLRGHRFSIHRNIRAPHFHFQMKIDERLFISFGDLHVPFTEEDLFQLPILLGLTEHVKMFPGRGAGMQEMMGGLKPKDIIRVAKATTDEKRAMYHMQTVISAKPGQTISGEDLAKLVERQKQTGESFAKLAKDLPNAASVETFIEPGEGVPEMVKRKKSQR